MTSPEPAGPLPQMPIHGPTDSPTERDTSWPRVAPLPRGLTAEQVFRRLSRWPGCLFLDSASPGSNDTARRLARYSFVTADPYHTERLTAATPHPLAPLRSHLEAYATPTVPGLPPFQGGLAGLFGYELGHCWERLPLAPHDEFGVPWLCAGWYDVVVAFDHLQQRAWVISQGTPETAGPRRAQRAQERLDQVLNYLVSPESDGAAPTWVPPPTVELSSPVWPVPKRAGLYSNFTPDGYRAAVRQAIDYIRAGDVFQVNLSQRLLTTARTSAVAAYLQLRQRTPAPFAGFYDGGDFQIVSASPERFVQVRNRAVEARPIKGTRRRTAQPEADLFAGEELLTSEKDRAENVMIADLLRNDLSRVCRPDSLHVPQLCGLEDYGYVQHLVSVIRGELADSASPLDVLPAAFPGGSITGAPKLRAMEIITELEQVARGAYCGCLGYIGYDGSLDLNILIRTMTAARGWWQFPVGGGIVVDSSPDAEYQETWHKAAGILNALCPLGH